jgi:hypothetical protein
MILETGIVLLAVVAVGLTVNHFESKINKEKAKISIKESMDLAQVPVVTFLEGDTKLNFLLDSGGSHSHISKSAAKMLIGTPIDTDYTYTTSIGSDSTSKMIESILKYKNEEFKVNLFVNEGLDTSFEEVKKECGVQLHGILGADFLKEHKYVLDFAELVAYHK